MAAVQKTILTLMLWVCWNEAVANNLSVDHVGLVRRNVTAGSNSAQNYAYVTFHASWENSWRTTDAPNNWDAAWIFVKYRVGAGEWKHATLHTSSAVVPSGASLDVSSDNKGAFLYRSVAGTGPVNFTGVAVRWDYGLDGVLDDDPVTVKVFGIEMVYVPQGSFYVGSGGTLESGSFTDGSWTSGTSIPLHITSEASLTIGQSEGNLWGTSSSGTNTIGSAGTLSTSFPKGFNSFYCMKYSISQQQYVDFLNTLTYTRQTTRTTLSPSSTAGTYVLYNTAASPAQYQDRSGVAVVVSGTASSVPAVYACNLNNDGVYNSTDDGQNIECGFLSWADGAAYSAWAGLRPMSELEFEKASRGTAVPAADEYVWGGVTAVNISGFTGGGTAAEIATPSNANSTYLNNFGPLRVGVFATSTTTRAQAGASYYGILDLGGGVWERTVTVGNETGRLFTGSHGTGTLDANGDAVQSDWPGTDAVGAGFRGGDWDADPSYMEVSDRYVAALTSSVRGGNSDTRGTRGFRSVRTAP